MTEETKVTKIGEAVREAVSSSPYALYASDNPGSMITSVLLDGDNYNEWSTKMLNDSKLKEKQNFNLPLVKTKFNLPLIYPKQIK